VHKLPVLQQTSPYPGSQSYYHTTLMAICMLRCGYDRTFDNCVRWFYSRVGGHRQVYEVDRVQANHTSLQIEWLASSTTFCTDSASPTLSSRTWDPISTRISSWIFVNVVPLRSSTFQCLTRGPMARLSVPTAWFLMAWRKDSTTRTTKTTEVDQWDLISNLGASHTTKQSHRTVTFLPRIWV
jgi:hypothetical protein